MRRGSLLISRASGYVPAVPAAAHLRSKSVHAVQAVVRRIVPRSPKYGFPWLHRSDGLVTFRERGFVAANGPAELMARHNYEVRRIHDELGDHSFSRSLEIGCGYGRLSMTLAQRSAHHVAIDINSDAITVARSSYPDFLYSLASGTRLPFPDGCFDLVCTWTVVQHIPPPLIDAAAAEMWRVLAPGGVLLMCEETRDPAGSGGHTWHRTSADYQRLFPELELRRSGFIEEIDAIPGMVSPGEVMYFSRSEQAGAGVDLPTLVPARPRR